MVELIIISIVRLLRLSHTHTVFIESSTAYAAVNSVIYLDKTILFEFGIEKGYRV